VTREKSDGTPYESWRWESTAPTGERAFGDMVTTDIARRCDDSIRENGPPSQ